MSGPRAAVPGRARVPRADPASPDGSRNGRLRERTVRHRPYRVFLFFTPPASFLRNLWELNSCCKTGAVPTNPL